MELEDTVDVIFVIYVYVEIGFELMQNFRNVLALLEGIRLVGGRFPVLYFWHL